MMVTFGQLWVGFTTLLVPTIAVVLAVLPVARRRLEQFARQLQVPLDTASADVLVPYLSRTRCYRSVGGALGWLLAALFPGVTYGVGTYVGGIVGYLVGALLAEMGSSRNTVAGPRRAVLTTRRPADYVSRLARLLPPALAVLAGAVLLAGLVYPPRPPARSSDLLVLLAVALGLAALIAAVQQVLITRAQRIADPVLLRIDDALRASSSQTITGAGGALALTALFAALQMVDRNVAPEPLGWLLSGSVLALPLLALLCWSGLRHWAEPVRRPDALS